MADPIRASIDLGALRFNIDNIRKKVGRNINLLCVLKADAYGHGAVAVAKYLKEIKVEYVGVATIDEAVELYYKSKNENILIFNMLQPENIEVALRHNFKLTAGDEYSLARILEASKKLGIPASIHFKVDTGMGRLGAYPEQAFQVLKKYSSLDELNVEGIYSHFAASNSEHRDYSFSQLEKFKQLISLLSEQGIEPRYIHMANSGAILEMEESYFNMVRPGILTYGYYPSSHNHRSIDLKPAMTLTSQIIFIKRMKKGDFISYDLTYRLKTDAYIASVRAGYGDGYSRALSNRASVLINDRHYPVVGRVCMDQILVNLGDDYYEPGQEVVLFGQGPITAETLARSIDAIPYEILCSVGKRVPRFYYGGR